MRRLLVLLALLLPCGLVAQWGQPNASQTKYQSKDTLKIRWNLDDSSGVSTSQLAQLITWYLRNNDYGSSDGIHVEVQSPDGDSVLAGFWMSGNGRAYIVSGHQSKLIATPTGTQLYGNYVLNPITGGTYPFFILKNSGGDSTWLSMAANGLPQWNRALNLPNSFPASPATGDFGRTGNILYFQSSIAKFGIDFGTAPSVGMGLRYAGGGIWSPGYPDTSGSGGGGGSSRWDSLTAPGDTAFLNMSVYKTTMSFGEIVNAPAFRITSTGGGYSDALFQVDVGAGDSKNIAKFVNSSGYGVLITNAGGLAPTLGGYVSANKWDLLDTVKRSALPAKVAFEDEANTFTAAQIITGTSATQMLEVANSNAGASHGIFSSIAGSGAAVYGFTSNLNGAGIKGSASGGGTGIIANSISGVPLMITYNDVLKFSFSSSGMHPATTGGYNVGNEALHVGDVWTDSLFLGSTQSAELTWRGDGALVRFKDTAAVFVTDTLVLNWSWVDSTYNATWGFIGKSGIIASPGGKCYNNGDVELTSTTGPMAGSYVWVHIRKRN